eukprot:364831-Chlamydomonas_euryale.AAC.14
MSLMSIQKSGYPNVVLPLATGRMDVGTSGGRYPVANGCLCGCLCGWCCQCDPGSNQVQRLPLKSVKPLTDLCIRICV